MESRTASCTPKSFALTRLAERFGTPLYVYSAATIRQRYELFDKAFRGCEHTVCYSVKANSNLSILRLLAGMGAGFDIVSGGELQRVTAAARKAVRNVVFSGVGKLAGEIDAALQAGILLFNVESEQRTGIARAHALPTFARRRILPFGSIPTSPPTPIPTSRPVCMSTSSGFPWRDAAELYRYGAEQDYLQPRGVSVHIGSQITDAEPFQEAMERVVSLVRSLRAERYDIRYVDAGGGLGISYEDPASVDFPREVKQYATALRKPLQGMGLHLLLEPGRAIIATAGVLLTRVVYRKRNDAKQFVIVDAAMNDLIRPRFTMLITRLFRSCPDRIPGMTWSRWTSWGRSARAATSSRTIARSPGWQKATWLRFWMRARTGCRWRRITIAGRGRPRCWWMASG